MYVYAYTMYARYEHARKGSFGSWSRFKGLTGGRSLRLQTPKASVQSPFGLEGQTMATMVFRLKSWLSDTCARPYVVHPVPPNPRERERETERETERERERSA